MSTRLLIFEGDFQRLSVAIYGTIQAQSKAEDPLAEEIGHPSRQTRLPETVDPVVLRNPLAVAQAILRRIPDAEIQLSTIIQRYTNDIDRDVEMNGNGIQHSSKPDILPTLDDLEHSTNPDEESLLSAATELGTYIGDVRRILLPI